MIAIESAGMDCCLRIAAIALEADLVAFEEAMEVDSEGGEGWVCGSCLVEGVNRLATVGAAGTEWRQRWRRCPD